MNPLIYGWTNDDEGVLIPLWYTGNQFPPSLQKRRSKGVSASVPENSTNRRRTVKKQNENFADDEADDEMSESTQTSRGKRRRKPSPEKDYDIFAKIEVVLPMQTISLGSPTKKMMV